jgi:hypothetical protein
MPSAYNKYWEGVIIVDQFTTLLFMAICALPTVRHIQILMIINMLVGHNIQQSICLLELD